MRRQNEIDLVIAARQYLDQFVERGPSASAAQMGRRPRELKRLPRELKRLLVRAVAIAAAVLSLSTSSAAAGNPEHGQRPPGVPAWPWYALAVCEEWTPHGIDWRHFSRDYEGGYGFRHRRLSSGRYVGTWQTFRRRGEPRFAHLAAPYVQTRVAVRVQRRYGWADPWPVCSQRLGLAP